MPKQTFLAIAVTIREMENFLEQEYKYPVCQK
jgi:hypothetical protein